jgi:hypothetical protein
MAKGSVSASQLYDYGHIEALWSEIRQILALDVATLAEVTARLSALEAEKIECFSLYWLNGEYLYLVHPQTPERKRWRQYVGNKKERVDAAHNAFNRRVQHDRLSKEQRTIERRAGRLFKYLTKFIRVTRGEI